jgi:hypothetical protein
MVRKTQRNPVDSQITQVKLRLHESTRLMLLAHAVRNNRSLNSEIAYRLEASLAEGSGTSMIARAIVRDLDPTLLDAIAEERLHNPVPAVYVPSEKSEKENERSSRLVRALARTTAPRGVGK